MSQQDKSRYYQALKEAGVTFDQPYRNYTEAELKQAYDVLIEKHPEVAEVKPVNRIVIPDVLPERATSAPALEKREELPGERLNQVEEDEVVYVDADGLEWLQVEIAKPASPRPRGRRVLKQVSSGVRQATIQDGRFTESFEVPDDTRSKITEIKITLPSYQVGIYRDPRYPFKVITYGGAKGFDLFEVEDYYGGADMVPDTVKRTYVDRTLCYDIRTVIRDITDAARRLNLKGTL